MAMLLQHIADRELADFKGILKPIPPGPNGKQDAISYSRAVDSEAARREIHVYDEFSTAALALHPSAAPIRQEYRENRSRRRTAN